MDIPKGCEPLECHRLECITDEDGHRLTILFPHSWESTTEYVVVHTWEIIVHECETMHELESDQSIDDTIRAYRTSSLLIGEDREDGTQSLASSLDRMSESRYELRLDSVDI